MEPYTLTQADIDDLLSRGFDMRGVSEGTEAMPAEVEALGITAPAAAPADQGMSPIQMEYSAARAAGVAPENAPQEDPVAAMGGMPATTAAPIAAAPAVAAAPTAAYGGANMMDLLSKPIPQDPFENLSRRQRTMLGFAALQDAGLALQGKQGSAFSNTLSGFRDRADMERKRQVQLATLEQERARQAQMNALFMGMAPTAAAGATGAPAAGSVSIQAQIDELRDQFPAYAGAGQTDAWGVRMKDLQSQLEATTKQETAQAEEIKVSQGKLTEARSAMSTAKRALAASLGMEEGKEFDQYLEGALAGGEFDPSAFAITRQGFVPDSRRFKDFQSAASQLSAMMTFQNMGDVIAAGAKLGILSDSDMRLLGSLSGVIDPENMPRQTAENIFRLYGKLGETISRIEGDLSSNPELDAILKKYEDR